MKITIQCRTFANLVAATKELLNDVNLAVTPDGLTMQSMDSAHVALCMLALPKTCFSSFEVDEPLVIGINVTVLSMALNCLDLDSELLIEYIDADLCVSTNGERGPRCLKLHTMDIDTEEMQVPPSVPQGVVELDARDFASLCVDSMKIGADGQFNLTTDRLNIKTIGDLGEATFEIIDGVKSKVMWRNYIEISRFNWKYLSLFSRAKLSASRVQLHFVSQAPLKILFPVAGDGTLTFYLAPRF